MDVRQLKNHLVVHSRDEAPRVVSAANTEFDQAAFGAAIRRLRGERNWTLRELSERSGISQSALSRVETGQITLSFDRAHALSRALGAEFTQFLKQMSHPP